jgi:hypothetical protein
MTVLLLTEDALLLCGHLGRVAIAPSQRWVTVEGRALLVATDPEGRPIALCPNVAAGKPCTATRAVDRGYSGWVRVDGHPVCRLDLVGVTDGMPPTGASYSPTRPGQSLVAEDP